MWHLYILVVALSNPLVPQHEIMKQTFDTENVCSGAGQMRVNQLNQDRNQVAGFVCLKF